MKRFVFDRLVDRENICNLEDEQRALRQAVQRPARVVVYGPRNFGKTSVVHNVTIEEFRSAHGRSFVFAADLLGVRSMQSLTQRMAASLQRCFAASFPVKGLLENAGRFLGSLRPQIALDPQTGSPSLSLHPGDAEPVRTLQMLWDQIARITEQVDSLIVLDEFQDVAFVDEAPAQMRSCLEALGDVPIVLLGSKRHMLADLFAAPGAPLSQWGTDLQFKPIPYEDYHAYIQERFSRHRLQVSLEVAVRLQDGMQRVPEAINRLCAQLLESHENAEIDHAMVGSALVTLLENREGRYASYLSTFSGTDETVLTEVARQGTVEHPQSKSFLRGVNLSSRTVGLSVKRLWDQGVVEHVEGSYRIADPLLAAYLRRYR
ncbi:MAG: hypothetical protein OXC31_24165 [Spirochaetaceae bacterium]|nr:hypothetical protein [Spirochaetaceae bacterium]